ncbi:hypothetical protein [Mesorhizobium sangaii]|uniref:Uncharacterized protein n=1 Tax=Mesorhizobium sangaii TaxID=505389 RepID=A0A841PVN9_9HYPH|nr:hypothetical protein [Mesorhizobium sangaii]MBB6414182.1 hypothetical protein [Mesorhizobium sangaii]
MKDDEFRPKLGKIGSRGSKAGKRYAGQRAAAASPEAGQGAAGRLPPCSNHATGMLPSATAGSSSKHGSSGWPARVGTVRGHI